MQDHIFFLEALKRVFKWKENERKHIKMKKNTEVTIKKQKVHKPLFTSVSNFAILLLAP